MLFPCCLRKDYLDNVFNFINENKSTDIKILDARVKNQIILNE